MKTTPESQPQLPFRRFLLPTLLMTIGGWGGLVLITNYAFPTLWPRWGFFALIVVALTGTALPVSYFINRTFSNSLRPGTILREALWVGVYGATLAWLQLGRILNFSLGLWLAVGIIIIEYIIRWSDVSPISTARPDPTPDPDDDAP
jgi:hypothetical protein